MLAAVGCAGEKRPQEGPADISAPTPTPFVSSETGNTDASKGDVKPHVGDEKAVVLINGKLSGSPYYWDFFINKINSGFTGSVKIVDYNGEEKTFWIVAKVADGFAYRKDGQEKIYSSLAVIETSAPADTEASRLVLGILTDEPGITAQAFFGGEVPSDVRAGFENDKGIVVYMKAD